MGFSMYGHYWIHWQNIAMFLIRVTTLVYHHGLWNFFLFWQCVCPKFLNLVIYRGKGFFRVKGCSNQYVVLLPINSINSSILILHECYDIICRFICVSSQIIKNCIGLNSFDCFMDFFLRDLYVLMLKPCMYLIRSYAL